MRDTKKKSRIVVSLVVVSIIVFSFFYLKNDNTDPNLSLKAERIFEDLSFEELKTVYLNPEKVTSRIQFKEEDIQKIAKRSGTPIVAVKNQLVKEKAKALLISNYPQQSLELFSGENDDKTADVLEKKSSQLFIASKEGTLIVAAQKPGQKIKNAKPLELTTKEKDKDKEKKAFVKKDDRPIKTSSELKGNAIVATPPTAAELEKLKALKMAAAKKKEQALPRKNVYKFSKRFLQIDANIEEYNFNTKMRALANNASNRRRYPSGILMSDKILVKDAKKSGDFVIQNKSTNNFSVFDRVIKFKTKDVEEKNVLNDLEGLAYRNKNELSMINHVYELEFTSPEDAATAYKKLRKLSYVEWSSMNVVEYEKLSE